VIPPCILPGLFGSYDTFTYLTEQESSSFISVRALQGISETHLLPIRSTATWRHAAGDRRAELI